MDERDTLPPRRGGDTGIHRMVERCRAAADWNLAPAYSEAVHGELKRRIAGYLERV